MTIQSKIWTFLLEKKHNKTPTQWICVLCFVLTQIPHAHGFCEKNESN